MPFRYFYNSAMRQNYFDFIICGAGASGLLLLKALREDAFFENRSILIIEKEIKNKNDRTWCYWESLDGTFDSMVTKKWSKAQFCSQGLNFDFDLDPFQYKMLRSAVIYQEILNKYSTAKNTTFLQAEVYDIISKENITEIITSEGKFQSKKVFNSLFDPKAMMNQKGILFYISILLVGLLRQKNHHLILVKSFLWILIFLNFKKLDFYISFLLIKILL